MRVHGLTFLAAKPKISAIATVLMAAIASSSASAQQPPRENCVAVSKGEYDSASRTNRLSNRVGSYVRTRRLWRRYYWYCRP